MVRVLLLSQLMRKVIVGLVLASVVGCSSTELPRSGSGGNGSGGNGSGGSGGSGTGARDGSVGGEPGSGGFIARGVGGERSFGIGGSGMGGAPDCGSCTLVVDISCGSDGLTYRNPCFAACQGIAIVSDGACAHVDGGDVAPGSCNSNSDCTFRQDYECCGACLAPGQIRPPVSSGPGDCGGVDCIPPPGGCACVNHACVRGPLGRGAGCDAQHDLCGSGLKCCQQCGGAPLSDGGLPVCGAAVCTSTTLVGGLDMCPAAP
jgi:hypothetical protein